MKMRKEDDSLGFENIDREMMKLLLLILSTLNCLHHVILVKLLVVPPRN